MKQFLDALVVTLVFVAFVVCCILAGYMYTQGMTGWSVYFVGCALLNGHSLYRLWR